MTLVLRRSVQQLDAVLTTEAPSLLRQRYHIDADAIAKSDAVLIDSFDIISKLRPDIVWGRGNCGGAVNIWVNGRWIPPEVVLENEVANQRARSGGPSSKVSKAVLQVLTAIPPDDVAEMTFVDCRNTSLNNLHAQSALFVILKDGLRFDPGSGVSRVVSSVDDSAQLGHRAHRPSTLILGVFDWDAGRPIPDALVRDSITGTSARTTNTGTVSLVFLDQQDTVVTIHKVGYRDTTIIVPRGSSAPITVTLRAIRPNRSPTLEVELVSSGADGAQVAGEIHLND